MFTEGMMFDRYKLIKLLGRGGFSEVWLAKDDKWTGLQVAIKIYAPGMGLDDDGVNMFIEEFKLVFDLNHTNLLRPTHFDCWERQPYLILPYCSKGSTFQYIKERRTMPEEECWKMIHDVASGLAYMHEKKPPLVHQDIKPDNILINDEGRYVITDFGISTRVRSTIRNGQSQEQSGGTMAYMGPECFSAKPKPIMAGDIWSMGAMMYELTTGMPPFGNHGGVLQKNGAEIPIIEEDYSQELKDLIYSMLTAETWKRPSARNIEDLAYNKLHGLAFDLKKTLTAQQVKQMQQMQQQQQQTPQGANPLTDSRATVVGNNIFNSNPTIIGTNSNPITAGTPSNPITTVPASLPFYKQWWFYLVCAIVAVAIIGIGVITCSGGSSSEDAPSAVTTGESFDNQAQEILTKANSLMEAGNQFKEAHLEALYDEDNGRVEANFLQALAEYNQVIKHRDEILDASLVERAEKGKAAVRPELTAIRQGLMETAEAIGDSKYAQPFLERAKTIEAKLNE